MHETCQKWVFRNLHTMKMSRDVYKVDLPSPTMHSHNIGGAASNARKNCWLITAGNQSSADGWLPVVHRGWWLFTTEVAMDPGCRRRLWQDPDFFVQMRIRSLKFVKKWTKSLMFGLTLEYYRRSARPRSNEVIHVKLRKRKSARFELLSGFMFLCD